MSEEEINKAEHYNKGQYEVMDVLEDWGLDTDFCLGNTVKYIARANFKFDRLKDLKKARYYLDRRITKLESEKESKNEES